MAFICLCTDIPASGELRRSNTPQHLAYIESIMEYVLVAGPLFADGSGDYNASCFIYDTDDKKQALRLLHNDPYYKAGIYARVHCQRFRPAAGAWIGGKTW